MFRKLSIPLDGSTLSEAALPLGRLLAGATHATVDLIRVISPRAEADAEREAYAYLERISADLREGGIESSVSVARGDVAQEIVRAASAQHADLVVMATHARGGVRRRLLGSVAEHVLARSSAPTLLVHAAYQPGAGLSTLLVPIDSTCVAPVPTLIDLARACGARVVFLEVVEYQALYVWKRGGGPVGPEPDACVAAHQHVNDLAAQLRTAGVQAHGRVEIGAVAASIARAAADTNADVIVMSTHGNCGLARALQGSVADAVVHATTRPVLLCHRAAPGRLPSAAEVAAAMRRRQPGRYPDGGPARAPSIPSLGPYAAPSARPPGAQAGVHWRHLAGGVTRPN